MGSNCSTPETPNPENIFNTMMKMMHCGNGVTSLEAEQCSKRYIPEMKTYMGIFQKEVPSMSHCPIEKPSLECRNALTKYMNDGKPVGTNTSALLGHCSRALGNILLEDPNFKITSGGKDMTHDICKIYIEQLTDQRN